MKEIKISKGLVKFNACGFAISSGAFALMGIGIATGTITTVSEPINYIAGGLLGVNSIICGKLSYDCSKTLKKEK